MKQTVYIAGPMRGKPDYNRAAFNAAAKFVEEEFDLHPINPVDIERIHPCVGEDGKTDAARLYKLLEIEEAFARKADVIYLLRGWEYSAGARGELYAYLGSRPVSKQVVLVQGSASAASAAEKGPSQCPRMREV